MAVVTLKAIWVNDDADPSSFVTLRYAGSLSLTPTVQGQVSHMAGGRRRAIAQAGKATQWQVDSPHLTLEQAAWLDAHTGKAVWVRDWLGRRVFGIYWSTDITQHTYNHKTDVSFTVAELTPAVV